MQTNKKNLVKVNKTAGSSDTTKSVGRPPVVTQEVVNKLEEVFAIDGSISEACFYAGISRQTYYEWLKLNPEYSDRFEALRERPVLLARQTVIKDLKTPSGAQWYLSRKRKNEFGGGIEMPTQTGGMNVYQFFNVPAVQEEIQAMENKIKEALITQNNVQH